MIVYNLEPDGFGDEAVAIIKGFAEYGSLASGEKVTDKKVREKLSAADVLWTRLSYKIDAGLLDFAPRARYVVSPTTGLNHIDLDECAKRGITVVSLKGDVEFLNRITATAELTFALILEAVRQVGSAHRDVTELGRWERDRFLGLQLANQVIGIIGLGRIGKMVADLAIAFRMTVLFTDRRPDDAVLPPPMAKRVTLLELLSKSDVVSLHTDYSPANRSLMNAEALAAMKSSAWLINTSRGEMVDEVALLEALQSSVIRGAALDVLNDELEATRRGIDHPLINYARLHRNLILTPHIGGACVDAMRSTERHLAQRLRASIAADA